MARLSSKQAAFVREYLIDLNATQAAIRAGYSTKTATAIGHENLSKPNIQEAIEAASQERMERQRIDADYVLKRLLAIDNMDAADILTPDGTVRPLREWPEVWRKSISAIDVQEILCESNPVAVIKKIKWPDKLRNLELLGKHIGVQAFKEKVEHSGEISSPVINLTLHK